MADGQDPSPSAWPGPMQYIHPIHQKRVTALLLDLKKSRDFYFFWPPQMVEYLTMTPALTGVIQTADLKG